MDRTARVVIAATLTALILILPLQVSGASPPPPERPAPSESPAPSERPAPDPGVTFRIAAPDAAEGPIWSAPKGFPYPSAREPANRILQGRVQPAPDVRTGVCLAADPELCGFGAFVARSKPCLAAGDCPAFEAWERVMGSPGPRPAPESTVRAAGLTPRPAKPRD
ncbi:MAG: hypothetical protein GY719_00400 [bacterium]|nr:hypothetical protein [bacterium]